MGTRVKRRLFVSAAGMFVLMSGRFASAQQMGTVFLDFDGEAGTPQGNVTALDASIFNGLAATDTAALQSGILADMQARYAGLSVNITDTLPAGTFTRIVIGNTGTVDTDAGGVADELDFRNRRRDNVVSILASSAAVTAPAVPTYTVAQAARDLGNTASHELGHVLGLLHTDPASTFESLGAASVNSTEVMAAARKPDNRFNNLGFGAYSRVKLDISRGGVNVQPEVGAAVFTLPIAPDPIRAGDAGGPLASGSPIVPDANGRVVVLGSLNSPDDTSDTFTFAGIAGQHITTEAFSLDLSDDDGPGPGRGRIADPISAQLELVNTTGLVLTGEEYKSTSSIDSVPGADGGADSLLYDYTLPSTGTFGIRVFPRNGGDGVGDYELLLSIVPEPTSLALLTVGAGMMLRRRR